MLGTVGILYTLAVGLVYCQVGAVPGSVQYTIYDFVSKAFKIVCWVLRACHVHLGRPGRYCRWEVGSGYLRPIG